MTDVPKTQKLKLANSRKRFKELQELRKKKIVTKTAPEICTSSDTLTSFDSLARSSHTCLNAEEVEEGSHKLYDPLLPKYVDNFLDNYNHSKNLDGDENNLDSNIYNKLVTSRFKLEQAGNENVQEISADLSQNRTQIVPKNDTFTINENANYEYEFKNSKNLAQTNKESIENVSITENVNNFLNQDVAHIEDSNIESLRQLSNQMTQLVDSEYCSMNSITDLEKRNLELIAHLEQQKIISEQQQSLIRDLKMRVTQLEKEMGEKAEFSKSQLVSEVKKLKEDLQCHIQTIGMLVAEKTELSANLSQFEQCSKQKSAECEELKARLKTSRSRVADLEREINNLRFEKKQNKTITEEHLELTDRLQQERSNLEDQKELLLQDLLEVREKLRNSSEENLLLQQQINELSSKLSLANIRIQQISNEATQEGDLEMAMKDKFELEKQISQLNETLKTVTKERDDSCSQYQQYAQQQNAQLMNISSRLEQLQLENENLSRQEQDRIKHIGELERQLQSLQTDHVKFAVKKSSDLEIEELYMKLQIENKSLEEINRTIINEKEVLLKELEAKNDIIIELQDLVEHLQGNQPDSTKLLTMMESDKVAAAKAIQQNKELKQQMESMQEVFLKANNDKIELTEQINKEVKSNKSLLDKLQKTELHLQRLTDAIEIKDRELFHLQEKLAKLDKEVLLNKQVTDTINDCSTKDNIIYEVSNEFKKAKQILIELANEKNIPKDLNQEENLEQDANVSFFEDTDNKLESKITEIVYNTNKDNECNERYLLDKEIAMRYLEEKFKRIMQETADLLEEKQRLEHLVIQLQGETETIGEYIALYQQQRLVLKQKSLERDQQLKQLTFDREQMKIKLERLIELVRKLDLGRDTDDKYKTKNVYSEFIEEILTLLSEIKSSNLIHPDENVHHCSWCSGRLITV